LPLQIGTNDDGKFGAFTVDIRARSYLANDLRTASVSRNRCDERYLSLVIDLGHTAKLTSRYFADLPAETKTQVVRIDPGEELLVLGLVLGANRPQRHAQAGEFDNFQPWMRRTAGRIEPGKPPSSGAGITTDLAPCDVLNARAASHPHLSMVGGSLSSRFASWLNVSESSLT